MVENGKWQVAFWVLTFLVIGSFGWTTFCWWTNSCRISELYEKHLVLKEVANDTLHKIDNRLSRIEDKLGIFVK